MNNSLKVVLTLLGLSLLALAVTGSEIYSRLSYIWALLLIGNWLWSFLSLRGVKFSRHQRIKRGNMGQIFEEWFEIFNSSKLPRLWIEIQDNSSLPGSKGSHVVTWIGGRQGRSHLSRSRLVKRGIFELGPTIIKSGDPFGLFPVRREIPVRDSLMVYPLMVEVRDFPNPPGLLTGGEALRRRTHQITPNASSVREYVPGDTLNRIHWPTTVRRDKLMVKEFELDPLADIWLFVDAEEVVHASLPYSLPELSLDFVFLDVPRGTELPPASEEYAASASASIARYFLRRRRAVGLVLRGQLSNILPPDRGGRQLGKILEAMAIMRANGDMPFSALITAQAQHITRGSTIVLITPTVRNQFPLTVDFLVRRGLRPIVVLIDSRSFGGPPGTDNIAMTIKAMGVPVRKVVNGMDLEEALNLPA